MVILVCFIIRLGKNRKIFFFLVWDLFVIDFGNGVLYYCCYIDFYGCNGKNVWLMICIVMKYY